MLVATIITLLQPDIYVLPTVTAVSTRFLAMHTQVDQDAPPTSEVKPIKCSDLVSKLGFGAG